MARSIAIVSLGRGVGKTTISLNLALALHELGYKVLLFDTDFTKKNLIEHLDISTLPVHIGQVLEGDVHINDSIYTHLTGLKMIPSMVHGYDGFSYNYQDLQGDYDYIILDTPAQPENLGIVLENADEAFIVHGPEFSLKHLTDAADILDSMKVLNLGVILNNFSERSTDEVHSHPVVEKIPPDEDIKKSFSLKNPLMHTHPGSRTAKKFRKLAKRIS